MVHAIRFHKTGGPEVLAWDSVEIGKPGQGQVRLRQTAIGLNYVDTYFRAGVYPAPLPSGIGTEGAGVVEEVGPGVSEVKVGDRVAYAGGPLGAYAEARVMPADRLIVLPASITDRQGAAMMLQGLTVQYLTRRTYRVEKGDTILIHAAAGGIGLILCQWAKHLGATVIGTVGSDAKAELAKATFMKSLDCLRPLGLMVSFGQASGKVEPFDAGILAGKGSLYLTRPTLNTYAAKREDLVAMAKELFDVVASGAVKIAVNQTYALKDAAQAHRDLEGRKTTGSTVFTV